MNRRHDIERRAGEDRRQRASQAIEQARAERRAHQRRHEQRRALDNARVAHWFARFNFHRAQFERQSTGKGGRTMQLELTAKARRYLALADQAHARAICRAQPGYGTPSYRGDPCEAVALQQRAERTLGRAAR